MARKIIDIGTVGNDGTGDSIRDSFRKVNDNFRELYSSLGLEGRLTFVGLDDTPASYDGQVTSLNRTPILTVNNTQDGIQFKELRAGTAIDLDYLSDENAIIISSAFVGLVQDPNPRLGANLRVGAPGGDEPFKILELGTPVFPDEAVNKRYADSKIAIAGVDAIDPSTGVANSAFGRMTGPLVLSRDPEKDDDEIFAGRIAATKKYVDNLSSVSSVNIFVASNGVDERPGIDAELQGRSLSLAYGSIEAALKRAEEVLKEARLEIGPYEKLLTYDNGSESAFLTKIIKSPDDTGSGFISRALLSVDRISLNFGGNNYFPGDILEIQGGTLPPGGGRARILVLSTLATPGPISTFRLLSIGIYDNSLPQGTNAPSQVVSSAAPVGINVIGTSATFNINFKVSGVTIVNPGQDYGLVSVRITGGGGTGAFGIANVANGEVAGITITDSGSGFTSFPTVEVDLPRFLIFTDGKRTDFSGRGSTPAEISRSQDIRPGLFIKGVTSGALAQILAYNRDLVNDDGVQPDPNDPLPNEFFDVDIKFGTFIEGEDLTYGDVTKRKQVTVRVESGIYEEHYPLRVPDNVAVIGDEFRRVLVRPKPGVSSSSWAFLRFRRDPVVDGVNTQSGRLLDIAAGETANPNLYGYHYLTDPSKPVYPKINNKGDFFSAATLMARNKRFIQEEVIAWTNYQIEEGIAPFNIGFEYNQDICKRDVGLIVDSIVYDLKYGEYFRTVSAALKYYQKASSIGDPAIAIGIQLDETIASIFKIFTLAQNILLNDPVEEIFNTVEPQIIDRAFISEVGALDVVGSLINVLIDIIKPEELRVNEVNFPKNNDRLDIFLCNDATILRRLSGQGHGGFMMVLDPTGQILAKSPYAQECSTFIRSINAPTFAGGQYVDGFAGNLQFLHEGFLIDPVTEEPITIRLKVSGLDRFPQLPASVIIDDQVYRINYVRNFVYDPQGSTADFELDANTPWDENRPPGPQNVTLIDDGGFIFENVNHRLQEGATLIFSVASGGTLPGGIEAGKQYFVLPGLTNNRFQVSGVFGSRSAVSITSAGSGQLRYQRVYEVLMPGNRSMLGNDFTQINDLGYGIVANNGGLIEAVSMFSYYNQISMYSLNGGQIRSIGGSSAHGNFALVAEGADPLELPTPTSLYFNLSQYAKAYVNVPAGLVNAQDTLVLYVYKFDYPPLPGSEIEIIHVIGGVPTVALYTAGSIAFEDPANFPGVVKIDLVPSPIAGSEGLLQAVDLDTNITIRQRGEILLTNDLENVAVRPSTGLVLAEQRVVLTDDLGNPLDDAEPPVVPYRVLNFTAYDEDIAPLTSKLTTANNTFSILIQVTNITSNVCTTAANHRLKVGDKFIPETSGNNFVSGTTYFIIDVPAYNQFVVSESVNGSVFVLTNGSGLTIKGKRSHKLRENFLFQFQIPEGGQPPKLSDNSNLDVALVYFVLPITSDVDFQIAELKGGTSFVFSGTQTAPNNEFLFRIQGLTKTILREDYAFIRAGVFAPGEFRDEYLDNGTIVPVYINTIANQNFSGTDAAVFTTFTNHGLLAGNIIGIALQGPADKFPGGIRQGNYYVLSVGLTATTFTIASSATGTPISIVGADLGKKQFPDTSWQTGRVKGIIGDIEFAVQGVSPVNRARIFGSSFTFDGEDYIITDFRTPVQTGQVYAKITLNRPLKSNIVGFASPYTIASGVTVGTPGGEGNLTIRISLTRVTGHDLLEIGTGSYADTNYPSEIYGPPVNPIQDANETVERDVGRVFFVTTDQFGNFKVGRNFTVDQGTGEVKISANISLSNISGFQFRRGVAVAEFSNDDRFLGADSDVVATALATLRYIDRRLGASSNDNAPLLGNDIVPLNGGFLSLNGLATMKGQLNFGNNKGVNLTDPTNAQDAVNLRSLTYNNFQDFTGTGVAASNLIVFTGTANQSINAAMTGDIALTVNAGNNTVDAQINPGVILNADVNASAAIVQSKLNMNSATTRANATGITQADRGLASFDDFQFTATNGWISVKNNGIEITKIEKIDANRVLGNSTSGSNNIASVPFSTVVNQGLAVKKSQYNAIGFLRRTSTANDEDGSFSVTNAVSTNTANTIVQRDAGGAFSAGSISSSGTVSASTVSVTGNINLGPTSPTLFADTSDSNTVRIYGYGGEAGIRIQTGTTNITAYRNAEHQFRNAANTADAPIRASAVRTVLLTSGGETEAGSITGNWSLTGNSRLQATYSADLAEYYEGDKEYEVGTVLVFGGDKEVTITNKEADTRVAGVVSNNAAYSMYGACPGHKNLIALQGRVPCKVVGKIKKGEMLITSTIPGVAVRGGDKVQVGTVIGKALQDYNSDHIGTIEVAVGRT